MNIESKKSFITKYQLFATIVVTIIGVGFFSYPSSMAKSIGTDGWIVTIVSGIIICLLLYAIYAIVKINNYESLYTILRKNYGSLISKLIAIVFSALNIVVISVGMRIFAEVLKMYLLEKTPTEFILLVMIITGSLIVRSELETLIKFNEVSFWILFIPIYLVLLLLCKGADFTNILPILHNPINKYIKAITLTTFAFEGFEITYLILPYVKQKSQIPKVMFKSIIFIVVFYAIITILTIATFGTDQTKSLIWPTITMIKSINIPDSFIEQWQGIVMIFWIIFYITTFVNIYYLSANTLKEAFSLEDIKLSSIIVVPLIYLIALYPENLGDLYIMYNAISVILPVFTIVFLIIILLLISLVKRRGAK